MAISLSKNQRVNLTKEQPSLKNVLVGLGWDSAELSDSNNKETNGGRGFFGKLFKKATTALKQNIDCDASILVFKNNKCDAAVFYSHTRYDGDVIIHHGDNLVGNENNESSFKDCEQITIQLDKLPNDINKLIVFVNIYNAANRKQDFGMVKNSYIRLMNEDTGTELYRYDLNGQFPDMTSMEMGILERDNSGSWNFTATGTGSKFSTIDAIINFYRKMS